jgi:hypothetical protein
MLYAAIVIMFALLVFVAVKLAQAGREVRSLKAELHASVTIDAALYAGDRRYDAGLRQGQIDGLIAAEKAAIKALIEGKPVVLAIRKVRNAIK